MNKRGAEISNIFAVGDPFTNSNEERHFTTTLATMIADAQAEGHLLVVSAVVRDLIAAYEAASTSSAPPQIPNVSHLRAKYAKKFGCNATPRLTDVLAGVPDEWKERLRGWLRAKPVRTASGVAVVAVMCKPHRCPHVAMTGNICV